MCELDEQVLKWLKKHEGETFPSPRYKISKRKKHKIRIVRVGPGSVEIEFVGSPYRALPLYFWMFDRTLAYLRKNRVRAIRLGSKVQPPYEPDTIEEQIWKDENDISPYKAAPHVCNILALAGLVEYVLVENPVTGRRVQAVKLTEEE